MRWRASSKFDGFGWAEAGAGGREQQASAERRNDQTCASGGPITSITRVEKNYFCGSGCSCIELSRTAGLFHVEQFDFEHEH